MAKKSGIGLGTVAVVAVVAIAGFMLWKKMKGQQQTAAVAYYR